jgi:plastocyanin
LVALPFATAAADPVEIRMLGTANGSEVWFDPLGIRVPPGTTLRWRNGDPGNSHTTTAFHPQNNEHPLRIPTGAISWNSGYLLPEEAFSVTLTVPGVYDYFCIPHEMAGMVGRIVVVASGAATPAAADEMADKFPTVAEIMRKGSVKK